LNEAFREGHTPARDEDNEPYATVKPLDNGQNPNRAAESRAVGRRDDASIATVLTFVVAGGDL
jgi:hypothetical protein